VKYDKHLGMKHPDHVSYNAQSVEKKFHTKSIKENMTKESLNKTTPTPSKTIKNPKL
jgi:hypothetical protein